LSAAKYLLSCRGGYKEHTSLEVEPGEGLSGLMAACGVDSSNVRERILARIAAIRADGEPDPREADSEPKSGT
jgi:hypothetical protein